MYLVRLVYASSLCDNFGPGDVVNILESARKYNKHNNITGLLCFNRKIFLQCLEGSRGKVNETYCRILNDNRHERVIMLDYQEIIERDFGNWSMGFVPETKLTSPINLKFSGSDLFDPYDMSGESAHRMMVELRDSIPLQE